MQVMVGIFATTQPAMKGVTPLLIAFKARQNRLCWVDLTLFKAQDRLSDSNIQVARVITRKI